MAILGCRESARSPQQRRRVAPGIGEELVEELVAGSYAIAGIRAVGETPLTLARTSEEEGLQAVRPALASVLLLALIHRSAWKAHSRKSA